MKRNYTTPKLTSFGKVSEITQIVGGNKRTDFLFESGEVTSDSNDLGSLDLNCPTSIEDGCQKGIFG
ncbi:hypothetical protein NIES267_68180 [Calothrix parasitica NIES-267]|uniref:Lasso peptide n=1 Tax=Calothrix parasitica NIES-267 TaxID=1973488 RepID=A0A1Z4M1F8_9CYAN|nr:hypothetical protein NIES267_68180 [Calothrix parasitica NIES-267]